MKERYSIYDDIAIVEFYWVFDAVLKANNAQMQTKGCETQIWRKSHNEWKLVHIHYSGMPVTGQDQGF
ncbi:MAG: nuclear transport factor 2 family protein [Bacteroidales bacterium]|nr:nuclear transport factor 2 family protein [Bacteroidales bacterium]